MRTRDESKEACLRIKAMEMIVAEGFDGLSMQKLAKAAGVSPATIYIYWKNREDLLNQLFQEVQENFTGVALEGFSPEMSLSDGLWLQWQNRLRFILEFPVQFAFYEQFRHSPLINRGDMKFAVFKENMQQFIVNAVRNQELRPMPTEVYWSMAYAPFYSLVRCKYQGKSMLSDCFELSDDVIRQTFEMVIKALRP
ncbi:MAG: TetR/AcrR family transcriptional regulator [Bacteroidetes bacterium]|nr:TetR/AcrR family transcriptional regulator [Bacteroidota bacterium]MBP6638799.1 TetR/AcrR family transcriptional regulator [Bacteroidia bacterium]MBP8073198.1 TetR/AcrR family transcriptional regulator [Bacteroidia bacterium]